MKKKVEMVMLPTKTETNIYQTNVGEVLYSETKGTNTAFKLYLYLYATVSQDVEAIEEGDWYIDDTNAIRRSTTSDKDYWEVRQDYVKVIATNDPKFTSFACNQDYGICAEECQGTCNSIKRLSLSSIKEYVSNPDGEFEVEYEVEEYTSGEHQYTKTPKLKLIQDNEVEITSVERKMYSKEEVEGVLYQYAEDEHGWFSSKSEIESFNNWIEENL